jgi:hypothetical protein
MGPGIGQIEGLLGRLRYKGRAKKWLEFPIHRELGNYGEYTKRLVF